MSRIGVLVMAYGTATGPDDIERYYTDIRGGRRPSPEHLEDLRRRYAAIGYRFPLLETTAEQARLLQGALNGDGPEVFRTYLGMKHSPPFIADGIRGMREDEIVRGIGLVMAPHWSSMSVETYVRRVEEATGDRGPPFTFVRSWHDHPAFVRWLSSRVAEALDRLSPEERERAAVVFSAHSLPVRTLQDGSRRCLRCHVCPIGCAYERQLHETADLVAGELGLDAYTIGWQSAGRTRDPWWGPGVEQVIRAYADEGRPAVVVCSAGFVADHLETLYDLDVEARAAAGEAGLRFERTEMPNADPAFVGGLAGVVRDHLVAVPTA